MVTKIKPENIRMNRAPMVPETRLFRTINVEITLGSPKAAKMVRGLTCSKLPNTPGIGNGNPQTMHRGSNHRTKLTADNNRTMDLSQ